MLRYAFGTAFVFAVLGAGCATDAVTRLDLRNQELTSVSQDIFTQKDLVELDVSHNRLKGALPAEIRQLSRLQVLDASDNVMTGVPAEIGQLQYLRVLDLSNNDLTGLPLELGQLSKLEILDLRGNAIVDQDLATIREDLAGTQILVDDEAAP